MVELKKQVDALAQDVKGLEKNVSTFDKRFDLLEQEAVAIKTANSAQTKILTEICRSVKTIQRDGNKTQLSNEKRISKVETEIVWIRRVGLAVISALGLGGLFGAK